MKDFTLIRELRAAACSARSGLPDAADNFSLGVSALGLYSRASLIACAYEARRFDMSAASSLHHR